MLVSLGYWGWASGEGIWRYILMIGVPLVAAVLWGTFNVPGDKSRSGKAPVPVPGIIRLGLELGLFAFAAWGFYEAGEPTLGIILGVLVLVHYTLSYDRILWLFKH
jgi:hypothetical protein